MPSFLELYVCSFSLLTLTHMFCITCVLPVTTTGFYLMIDFVILSCSFYLSDYTFYLLLWCSSSSYVLQSIFVSKCYLNVLDFYWTWFLSLSPLFYLVQSIHCIYSPFLLYPKSHFVSHSTPTQCSISLFIIPSQVLMSATNTDHADLKYCFSVFVLSLSSIPLLRI